jgi:hypothetical protein
MRFTWRRNSCSFIFSSSVMGVTTALIIPFGANMIIPFSFPVSDDIPDPSPGGMLLLHGY